MGSFFSGMRWDWWEVVGLLGEGLFFARLIVQWIASEKARRPVLPMVYWFMSLVGAVILIFYAVHLGSFAVLIPQLVGIVFYARGIMLERGYRDREAARKAVGLDRPDYLWPTVSLIVPAKNEESVLAGTLSALVSQSYPGKFEVIVALNGCTDGSRKVAERFQVTVVESEKAGISFGRNLGAKAAEGDILIFVDADTLLPQDGLRLIVEAMAPYPRAAVTVPGRPDRGGAIVRITFWIANYATRRKGAHAPGGVVGAHRTVFDEIGGFDESLPQITCTEFLWRAAAAGATYVYVDAFAATTSIRRFEKKGIIQQMLDWRKRQREIVGGRREAVEKSTYEDVR